MTPADRAKLEVAERHVSAAVNLIKLELPTIEAFLAEKMGTGNESEDRAARSILAPLFEAARDFVQTHDAHLRLVKLALAVVKERA